MAWTCIDFVDAVQSSWIFSYVLYPEYIVLEGGILISLLQQFFVHYFKGKKCSLTQVQALLPVSPFFFFSFCAGCVEGLMWGRSHYVAFNFLEFTMYIILTLTCVAPLNSSVLLNAEFVGTHLHAYVSLSFYLLYVLSFYKSLTLRTWFSPFSHINFWCIVRKNK